MRVTHFISNQQFLTNNNMLLTRQIKSNNRIATQRRFDRVSEDTVNGSKAMTIRREIRDISIYDQNLSSAKSLFDAAEKNLTFIAHDNYIEVEERLVAAVNDTHDQMELDIYATELDEIAENMVTVLNHDISERELFGGASNGQTPFQIQRCIVKDGDTVVYPPDYNKYYDADGNILDGVALSDIPRQVTYNGIPVDFDVTSDLILPDGTLSAIDPAKSYTIEYLNEDTLKFEAGDPKKGNAGVIEAGDIQEAIEKKDNSLIFPGSKPIYVDIGLGIKYIEEDDGTYRIDPQTALDVSMNGAEITGCGIDIEDVETSKYVTATESLTNGAATGSTLELTINGQPAITINLDTVFQADGTVYSDEDITTALNTAIKGAYEAGVNTLPEDVSVTCKDGLITINTGDTAVSVGDNTTFGIAAGDIPTMAALDDDGNPVLTSRYSKNLVQLVLDSANALRRGDQEYVNAVIDRANTANNHILREITTLGAKQNSIDFYTLKNDDYEINLKERQNVVEGTDMENEVIEYEGVRAAYEAVLKMSSTILGSSIFDFI